MTSVLSEGCQGWEYLILGFVGSLAKYDVLHDSLSGSDPGSGDLLVELTYTRHANSIFHHYSDSLQVRFHHYSDSLQVRFHHNSDTIEVKFQRDSDTIQMRFHHDSDSLQVRFHH